jgi:hypothetical protein
MGAVVLPPPPFSQPLLEGGFLSRPWRNFIQALYFQVFAGGVDKVDAAYKAAVAAAPAATQVLGAGRLSGGGALSGNVAVALYRVKAIVAALPAKATEGDWAYALNGRKPGEGAGAGTGVPCFWSGTHWIAVTSGVAVTA